MEIKKGIGVSPGVVISTAVVLDAEDLVIPKRQIEPDQIQSEIERLGKAVAKAVVDLTRLRDNVTGQHGKEIGGIFNFHLGLLSDPTLQNTIVGDIRTNHSTAEYAAADTVGASPRPTTTSPPSTSPAAATSGASTS